jgi:hypothetical protein
MTTLLEQLFHDLLQRYRFLSDELSNISTNTTEVLAYRDRIKTQIDRFIEAIEGFLDDPDLSQPDLARNIYHAYKRLSEYAQFADEGPVSALSRFQPRDLFLTRLVSAMCAEFNFPHPRPLCSAITTQYYCILPHMDLLLVPHSEPDHLLGLPDIYHELGHLLFRDSATLIERLRARSQAYYEDEMIRAQREAWPINSIEALKVYNRRWFDSWVIEFGCDLLATYVCGPAFGWTNARLCARLSPAFYEITTSHPADAARTIAIRTMLQNQSHIVEAHQIDLQWQELQKTAFQSEPQEFRLAFPIALLEGIVGEVVNYCQSAGIRPYDSKTMPIARLLNDSWQQFLKDPAAFRSWEAIRIGELKAQLLPDN